MDPLISFSIPIRGLRDGIHQFDFQIDRSFFSCFENAPVQDGDIRLQLIMEKRPSLYTFRFEFEGTVEADCDRCLAPIDLPIEGDQRLLVKVSEGNEGGPSEDPEDPDVIYISPEQQKFNTAPYAYEFICLAIPMIKTYDCQEEAKPPCNQEMLDRLGMPDPAPEEEEAENPIWAELKKLSNNN
jgi:uncharacterized protein